MHPLFHKADTLCKDVIAAAIDVQKHFGVGLLENIYKLSFAYELRLRGHKIDVEFPVKIQYKDFSYTENLRVDVLVDGCLIVECKSLNEEKINMMHHKAQLLSYMKLLDVPLGLVINFSDYRLGKRGIARVILAGADDSGNSE